MRRAIALSILGALALAVPALAVDNWSVGTYSTAGFGTGTLPAVAFIATTNSQVTSARIRTAVKCTPTLKGKAKQYNVHEVEIVQNQSSAYPISGGQFSFTLQSGNAAASFTGLRFGIIPKHTTFQMPFTGTLPSYVPAGQPATGTYSLSLKTNVRGHQLKCSAPSTSYSATWKGG